MPRETVTRGNHVGLISALPKWAQNEIHRLDLEVNALENLLGQAHFDVKRNEYVVGPLLTVVKEGEALFDRAEVVFQKDGAVEIRCPGMAIEPVATNRTIIHPRGIR